MNKLKNNQSGFSALEVILIVAIVGIVGTVGWYVMKQRNKSSNTSNSSNNSQTTSSDQQTNSSAQSQKLTISDWGIGIKLTDAGKFTVVVHNEPGDKEGEKYDGYATVSLKTENLQNKDCAIASTIYKSKSPFSSRVEQTTVDGYSFFVSKGSLLCDAKDSDTQYYTQFNKDFVVSNIEAL